MPSARVAVTRGSFWRSEPAAALRGLANSGLPASAIEALSRSKASTGQEHLAAHLDQRGHRELVGAGEAVRDRVDGLDVGGDVLAGAPVAAGQRADQPALLVEQVDREPVDLELAEQVGRLDAVAGEPGVPRGQLLEGEGVVEALHPLEVVDGGELRRDRAAHVLGRRVGGAQLRVRLLERLELAHRRRRSRRRTGSGRRARSSASARPRPARSAPGDAPRAVGGARARTVMGTVCPPPPTARCTARAARARPARPGRRRTTNWFQTSGTVRMERNGFVPSRRWTPA